MKKLITLLLCLPMLLFSQEESNPSLFEVMNIKVKAGQEESFEAAVKSHNTLFHGEGLYNARLFYNINGPMGGQYTWVMGPTNWTAMDTRPGEGAHNDDWKKVDEFVDSYGTPGYWSFSDKLSHVVPDVSYSKRLIWVYDIKRGQATRWSELIGKIQKVYKEKRPEETFYVVWNEFANTNAGNDAAIIFSFDKWAWMDRQSNFVPQYEEVHGPGSWRHFMNEFNETINGRVDWIRELVD